MRLINADELLEDARRDTAITACLADIFDIQELVNVQPTIEAVEVVHGKWVKDGDFLICLNCEAEINIKNSLGIENHKNFCPNCGADMRKDGAE